MEWLKLSGDGLAMTKSARIDMPNEKYPALDNKAARSNPVPRGNQREWRLNHFKRPIFSRPLQGSCHAPLPIGSPQETSHWVLELNDLGSLPG